MRTLYLCGAGNSEGVRLARTVQRHAARWDRIVLLDDDPARLGFERHGVAVVGPIAMLHDVDPAASEVVNLVARTTRGRKAVRDRILGSGVPFARLVHPEVDIDGVALADDVIVYRHATLGPESSLADGCCVFMGAVVGHESVVGPGCVVAPNAVLNARVVLGEGAYVGSNASILPEVVIGAWATVGAGSAVIRHVPEGATAVGVPAEVLEPARTPAGAGRPPAMDLADAEALVARVWAEVLRRDVIDPDANFFDQGGTSLRAMEARLRLRELAGIDLAITDLFRHPTVRRLAATFGRAAEPLHASSVRPLSRRAAGAAGRSER